MPLDFSKLDRLAYRDFDTPEDIGGNPADGQDDGYMNAPVYRCELNKDVPNKNLSLRFIYLASRRLYAGCLED